MAATAYHEAFNHEELNTEPQQIRLIKLRKPLPSQGLLRCDIQHFDLETCPEYIALSYCWGPRNPALEILVNDRTLTIRKNLHELLSTLQWHVSNLDTQHIWVDQICIDQQNIKERNHQVQSMRQIYGKASRVYAWVGAEGGGSNRAMSWFEKHGSHGTLRGHGSHDESPNTGSITTRAINDFFFTRPYWKRLWVVQEIVLAREVTVLCGRRSTDWRTMWVACSWRTKRMYLYEAEVLINSRSDHPGEAHFALWAALSAFGRHLCHDPRDKIYGLLGIVISSDQVEVDYRKSSEEVFKDTVNFLLRTQKVVFRAGNSAYKTALPKLGESMKLLRSPAQQSLLRELLTTGSRDPISEEDWQRVLDPDLEDDAVTSKIANIRLL